MNKIILLSIIFFINALSLYANKPVLTQETKALIKEAKSQTHAISETKMRAKMKEKKVVLLDVRDPDEWGKGSIAYDRQVKISRGFLEIKYPKLVLEKYTKEDTFIVYCALEPRSVFAAQRLQELGFKKVYYLKGGLKKVNKGSPCKVPLPKSISLK